MMNMLLFCTFNHPNKKENSQDEGAKVKCWPWGKTWRWGRGGNQRF